MQQHIDQVVGGDVLAVGQEGRYESVPEYRVSDRLDVVGRDVQSSFEYRAGLGTDDQVLSSSRAGTPGDVGFDELGSIRFIRPRSPGQVTGVDKDMIGDRYLANQVLQFQDLLTSQRRFEFRLGLSGGLLEDREFFVGRRIIDDNMEHEPVQLGLRQRVGSFLLDRVLRGEHEEWLWQWVGACADGHSPFLHRFQQRCLGFWRCSVDLVGEHDVGKQRPLHEVEGPLMGVRVVLQHVGAGDVRRHQVGGELDAAKRELQDLGNRAHQQCLGQAGNSLQQAVASGEQRNEQLVDDLVLADNRLADLLAHAAVGC